MQTRELACFVARTHLDEIPEAVQDEATRAIVNWLGCALGGALDATADAALDALFSASGAAHATLIGRGDRMDIVTAALVTGIASSALDFDDTHAATPIRPSVPIASALFPLAEHRGSTGAELLAAFAIGVEIACRAGIALGAAHARGWDMAAVCGVLGSAAACAKLLGLDANATAAALGIAATQAGGIAEMAASASETLNLGFAARNGLFAVLLARQGFTAAERALEGARGFLSVLGGGGASADALSAGLGSTWHAARIAYKPFACAAALHPVIDGCLHLRREHGLRTGSIAHVGLRVHPFTLQSAAGRDPEDAFAGRKSIHHGAAVALADGAAGPQQFALARIDRARVAQLRSRIDAIADDGLSAREARVHIALKDGRSVEHHVRCAPGGPERPLTDADLAEKFRSLATEALATDQAERLLALAWNMRALADVGALVRAAVPEEEIEPDELPGSPLIPR